MAAIVSNTSAVGGQVKSENNGDFQKIERAGFGHGIQGAMHPFERHDPLFERHGLFAAQARTREAVEAIAREIVPGMTEVEGRRVVARVLDAMGSPRMWHRPIVRIGPNTICTFYEGRDAVATLAENDLFFVDIGPTWLLPESPGIEWEGDVGDTFAVGTDETKHAIARAARELHAEACAFYRAERPSGARLYEWLGAAAEARGYRLRIEDGGHRISEFPHKAYYKEGLNRIEFTPLSDLWILEVHLADPTGAFGAFYEDVLR